MAENMKMNKMIGERIRAARKAKGLSQLELGDRLDVSFQAVSTWEQGKFIPDPAHLTALSGELDLSLDRLFAEEGNRWDLKPVNFDADHMFTFVKTRAQDLGLTQTLQVMPLLRIAHENQERRSKYGFETTYMVHPLTMACHALAMDLKDDDILAACLAHDMVEDSDLKLSDLPVNEKVRRAVKLVSKNEYKWEPGWEETYFKEIAKNPLASLVKCLDRVNNLAGMADAFTRKRMSSYAAETDRYYPDLLKTVRKVPEWNNAWWLLRYQMMAMLETFKRLL